MANTISIIIPMYNEENVLEKTLSAFEKLKIPNLEKQIICINDGSTDRTVEILERYKNERGFKILHNSKNLGKSQTVRKGILASSGDIVVIQDADLEYDPEDLILMSELILEGKADVVYGNRYNRIYTNKYSIVNYLGNKLLTIVSNFFTMFRGLVVPDMEVCHKMILGDIFRDIASKIKSKSSFGLEPEITAKVAKYRKDGKKLRVWIRSVKYFPRSVKQGKKMRWIRDGVKAIFEIIRYNVFD